MRFACGFALRARRRRLAAPGLPRAPASLALGCRPFANKLFASFATRHAARNAPAEPDPPIPLTTLPAPILHTTPFLPAILAAPEKIKRPRSAERGLSNYLIYHSSKTDPKVAQHAADVGQFADDDEGNLVRTK